VHPFLKSSQILLKTFSKEVTKSAFFLWKRSLAKILLKSFENLAPGTCYSVAYISQTRDQNCFTSWEEVAANDTAVYLLAMHQQTI